ncbi:uncharacterized protein LOC130700150 [Daphnia carinata]|uniref:uncharacterized protein LOC130700150 n=1 Tax=Daphnia carinata TaxID=120202 RepID=UPI00257FF68E|nr:uncharacterized protein LOC130700150 [Daphnia carinata]
MALILVIVSLCFGIAVADVKLPVPLAYRPHVPSTPQDNYCSPLRAPACVDTRFGFCISDNDYPADHVQAAVEYSDLAKKFSYKTVPREESVRRPVRLSKENSCISTNLLLKPIRMPNLNGHWRVIVQDTKGIIQRERIIACSRPGDYCHVAEHPFGGCHESRCSQKFVVGELLAYDPCAPSRGVFVDSFKMQSACNCLLSRSKC